MSTTSAISAASAWAASTAYSLGDLRKNGTSPVRVYKCTTAGTSASSGGPTGTGTGISDGTAAWAFQHQVDYSDPQLWHDAFATGGWIGECYNDAEFLMTGIGGSTPSWSGYIFTGKSTSATDYMTLRCATGHSFSDNPNASTNALRYNQANGVGIRKLNNYGATIYLSNEDYFTIHGLQIAGNTSGAGSGGSYSSAFQTVGSDTHNIYENLILETSGSFTNTVAASINRGTIRNSLLVNRSTGGGGITLVYGASATSCTIVRCSDKTATGYVLSHSYGTATLSNCAAFGFTSMQTGVGTLTSQYCMTDLASPPSGWTQITGYTSQFVNTVDATRDFRLVSGSSLINAGNYRGTQTDIIGTTKPQGGAYDIGCWEFVASGGTKALTAACTDSSTITVAIVRNNRATTAALADTTSLTANIDSGGPKALTAAISDTTTLTAAIIRNKKVVAALTDTTSLTTAIGRARAESAALTDTTSLTTAVIRNKRGVAAALSDTISLTTAITRTRPFAAALSDTTLLSASDTRTRLITVAVTDATSLTANIDSGAIKTLTAATSDTTSLTAIFTRARADTATITDASTITASIKRQRPIAAASTDSTAVTADFNKGGTKALTAASSDTTSLTSNVTRARKATAALTDSSSVTAAVISHRAIVAAVSDTTSLSADFDIGGSKTLAAASSDTTSLTAAFIRARKATAALTDSSSLTAVLARRKPFSAASIDSTTLSVTLGKVKLFNAVTNNTSNLTTNVIRARKATVALTDSTALAAMTNRKRAITSAISDSTTVATSLGKLKAISAAVSDTTSVTATIAKVKLIAAAISGSTAATTTLKRNRGTATNITNSSNVALTGIKRSRGITSSLSDTTGMTAKFDKLKLMAASLRVTSTITAELVNVHSLARVFPTYTYRRNNLYYRNQRSINEFSNKRTTSAFRYTRANKEA